MFVVSMFAPFENRHPLSWGAPFVVGFGVLIPPDDFDSAPRLSLVCHDLVCPGWSPPHAPTAVVRVGDACRTPFGRGRVAELRAAAVGCPSYVVELSFGTAFVRPGDVKAAAE